MNEQQQNIERVGQRIGRVVLNFCRERLGDGKAQFHSDELRRYVIKNSSCAPASPDRILRNLRQDGVLDYVIVSRHKSLYRITRIGHIEAPQLVMEGL